LKIEKSRYLVMTQNGSLKRIGGPPSGIFKIKFLTAHALERYVLFSVVREILPEILMEQKKF